MVTVTRSACSSTFRCRRSDGGVAIHFEIRNEYEDRVVREFSFRLAAGVSMERHALLWPEGLGRRFHTPDALGTGVQMGYPSGRGTMQWCAFAGSDDGLYIAAHDEAQLAKTFAANPRADGNVDLRVTMYPYVRPGETWTSPEFVVRPYRGTWHEAARLYRAWYDSEFNLAPQPRWVTESSGWLLGILKQQNGEILWDYRHGIDRLAAVALAHGLDTIGLFGWAHGGHDYLYPDYIPDPGMGGEAALREAIRRTRERGLRVVLYANGQLMDTSTAFYRYQGNRATSQRENTEPYVSSIRKFYSSTPVTFAQGCCGAAPWSSRMRDLAQQALRLGADGILYDQLGVIGPGHCHAPDHRHCRPSEAFTASRVEMVSTIAAEARARNADFVVMTEGVHDTLLPYIPYYHGWGTGSVPQSADETGEGSGNELFPQLFRCTFPELVKTQRHSTPMLDRYHANYAVYCGLRHEIEARYAADTAYLLDARVPDEEDYADCTYYPPNVPLMQGTPPAEATAYLKSLIEFETRQAAFCRRGRYLGDEGLAATAQPLRTAALRAADGRLAVLVWNPTDETLDCPLDLVPGRSAVSADSPAGPVGPATPLPPQSVRLLVYPTES
jgi:hypothetical protein